MKVYEIIVEDKDLEEAPAGMVQQGLRKVGSWAAKKVGMKQTAANLDTKIDVGNEANRIKGELTQWLQGSGIKKDELELTDLLNFLDNAGFDRKNAVKIIKKHARKDSNGQATLIANIQHSDDSISEAVDPKIIDNIIMDLVKLGFKKQAGGKQVRSKYAIQKPTTKTPKTTTTKAPSTAELKKASELLKSQGFNITKAD